MRIVTPGGLRIHASRAAGKPIKGYDVKLSLLIVLAGLAIPVAAFFFIDNYSPERGIVDNAMNGQVVITLKEPESPVQCVAQTAERELALALGNPARDTPACGTEFVVDYKWVVAAGAACVVIGGLLGAGGRGGRRRRA